MRRSMSLSGLAQVRSQFGSENPNHYQCQKYRDGDEDCMKSWN
jgi:hypothetical protein